MPFKINKKEHLLEKYIEEPGVTEVIIPEGIKEIDRSAFENCQTIRRVVLPEGLEKIGGRAFFDCIALAEIIFPASLVSVEKSSLVGTPWLENQTDAFVIAGSVLVLYRGTDSIVHIPDGIVGIGGGAFRNSCAEEIFFPENLAALDDMAQFSGCSNLRKVVMSDRIEKIPFHAFDSCVNLKEIKLSARLKEIGWYAFNECKSLKNIAFPDGLKIIKACAFCNCEGLNELAFPDSLEEVEAEAFSGCNDIRSVTLPHGEIYLAENAFGADGIEQITIPADCIIDPFDFSWAFPYLPALCQINIDPDNKNLTAQNGIIYSKDMTILCKAPSDIEAFQIPDGIEEIAPHAFYRCVYLREVQIPASVHNIAEGAFENCESLEQITIPEAVEVISLYTFSDCTHLESVTFPDALRLINCYAFCGCASLTSVSIPDGVYALGECAFKGCSALKNVSLPKNFSQILRQYNGSIPESRDIEKGKINYAYMEVFSETPWLKEQQFYKDRINELKARGDLPADY